MIVDFKKIGILLPKPRKFMKYSIVIVALLASKIAFAQDPITVNSSLQSATVYIKGAELMHTAKLIVPTGNSTVVIKGVAKTIDQNSIQITAPPGITIMSVSVDRDYAQKNDDKSPAYTKAQTVYEQAKVKLEEIQNRRESDEQTISLLDANKKVGGENSGLSVTELQKLVDYYRDKRVTLKNYVSQLKREEIEQQQLVNLLSKQMGELRSDPYASGGQLVLQVMATAPVNNNMSVKYISPNASWIPFYDLRADDLSKPIALSYKAKVQQTTGLDWKKVKLSLSTGNPSDGGVAPILGTWFLRFYAPRIYRNEMKSNSTDSYSDVNVEVSGQRISAKAPPAMTAADYTTLTEGTLQSTFDIDLRYDIAATGKPHLVSIKEAQQPASYQYFSIPRMDPSVYLVAEIIDFEKLNLLPGQANIIFDDAFVGTTFLSPQVANDTLTVSMGKDKRVSTKRELLKDKTTTRIFGTNQEKTFTYEITVKNSKSEAINLKLQDQYPISTDNDISVKLESNDKAEVNEETGALTWQLRLKPGEERKIRFSYSVKFPKGKTVGGL